MDVHRNRESHVTVCSNARESSRAPGRLPTRSNRGSTHSDGSDVSIATIRHVMAWWEYVHDIRQVRRPSTWWCHRRATHTHIRKKQPRQSPSGKAAQSTPVRCAPGPWEAGIDGEASRYQDNRGP